MTNLAKLKHPFIEAVEKVEARSHRKSNDNICITPKADISGNIFSKLKSVAEKHYQHAMFLFTLW